MTQPTTRPTTRPTSQFHVIPGERVREVLAASRAGVVDAVRRAYLLHHEGDTVNPPSHFLRFPGRPADRIIALPAYLGGEFGVAGLKWIASVPGNRARDLPRASAVLLLNDPATGFPFACLEASRISAARTAASAVLGAEQLAAGRPLRRLAVVGCGVIARTVVEYARSRNWPVDDLTAYDAVPAAAASLAAFAAEQWGIPARAAAGVAQAVEGADAVVLATTAISPHLHDPGIFAPGQVVLHLSLRDLAPAVVAAAHNVVDDVDHCLTADTSVHLTARSLSGRDFVAGTLAQLMLGELRLEPDRPLVFSPFGLGVLDLAVGALVHRAVTLHGTGIQPVAGFFTDTTRPAPAAVPAAPGRNVA